MFQRILITLLWLGANNLSAQDLIVSADKMNVAYIGLDNPISIAYNKPFAAVTTNNGTIQMLDNSHYIWKPSRERDGHVILRDAKGDSLTAKYFRVKRLPKPTPMLGGVISTHSLVYAGEMKAQQGIYPILTNSDIAVRCEVKGFKMRRRTELGELSYYENTGSRFEGKAIELIKAASPGDEYYFENIESTCPDDKTAENIGEIYITIL